VGSNRYRDPGALSRWREEPYYSQIKTWSEIGADNAMQVVIYMKGRAIVVLPNKEVDLGHVPHEDLIMVRELNIPVGRDWEAFVMPAEDIPVDQRNKWVVSGAS
jgi:hypothetical protein